MRVFVEASQTIDPPDWIKWLLGSIVGAVCDLLGGWDMPLQLMLTAQIANILFGMVAGTRTEGFMPGKLAHGIVKAVGYWGVVVIAVSIDQYLALQGQNIPIRVREMAVLGFFVADTISALSNAAILGVPVPTGLLKYVAKLRDLSQPSGGEKPA